MIIITENLSSSQPNFSSSQEVSHFVIDISVTIPPPACECAMWIHLGLPLQQQLDVHSLSGQLPVAAHIHHHRSYHRIYVCLLNH